MASGSPLSMTLRPGANGMFRKNEVPGNAVGIVDAPDSCSNSMSASVMLSRWSTESAWCFTATAAPPPISKQRPPITKSTANYKDYNFYSRNNIHSHSVQYSSASHILSAATRWAMSTATPKNENPLAQTPRDTPCRCVYALRGSHHNAEISKCGEADFSVACCDYESAPTISQPQGGLLENYCLLSWF